MAGLSNQNFASTLRVLNFPFTGKQSMASVQIYHATHNQMETRAPIREVTFARLDGKDYLVAVYMCTPLVTIPVDAIQDGAHITDKTIAELSYGNTPAGMLTFTADQEGKEVNYLIVTNPERSAEMIPLDQVEAAHRKDGMSKQVPMGLIGSITSTQTPFADMYRIDNLSPKYFVALRRDLATGKSQFVTCDKNLQLRLSDFVSEYNFPSCVYKGKLQVAVFKPAPSLGLRRAVRQRGHARPAGRARGGRPRSRPGNCYDNAMMESFWATLKAECFHGERPATRQAAKLALFDYSEGFYDRSRFHSSLGYLSPLAFETNLKYNLN